jgi:FkbM family methyltransferase
MTGEIAVSAAGGGHVASRRPAWASRMLGPLRRVLGRAPAVETHGVIPTEDVVRGIYHVLLGRDPDPTGMENFVAALERGQPFEALLDAVVRSEEFGGQVGTFARRFALGERRLLLDWTQYDELLIMLREMAAVTCPDKLVVDVGARGRTSSNSYDLLRHFGWRGLLIEANPNLRTEIERDFDGLDFELVSCAISTRTGQGTLTLGVNDDVSSLTPAFAETFGPSRGTVQVSVRRLGDVLDEHGTPHDFGFLSLDIEGEDVAVLNDLVENTPYRPRWAMVEASFWFQTRTLAEAGCSPAVQENDEIVGQTIPNLLLLRKDLYQMQRGDVA